MKLKLLSLFLVCGATSAMGAITLNTQFGIAYLSDGLTPVPDGTAFALVADADNNSIFAGGFSTEASLTQVGANTTFQTGQIISNGGLIGGDRVFALGVFNGTFSGFTGATFNSVVFDLNAATGVVTGRNFAFYWFPGSTVVANNIVVATQVGGINSALDAGTLGALVIPADGATLGAGASTPDLDGTVPMSRFVAVNLVPEPSSILLSAVGALGLLRRRR